MFGPSIRIHRVWADSYLIFVISFYNSRIFDPKFHTQKYLKIPFIYQNMHFLLQSTSSTVAQGQGAFLPKYVISQEQTRHSSHNVTQCKLTNNNKYHKHSLYISKCLKNLKRHKLITYIVIKLAKSHHVCATLDLGRDKKNQLVVDYNPHVGLGRLTFDRPGKRPQ